MFGYKLIKESELVKLKTDNSILFNAYKTICDRLNEKDDEYWNVKAENRELQETIYLYDEAMQEQIKECKYNLYWLNGYTKYCDKKVKQNRELHLTICDFVEALEAMTAERNMWFDTHEKAIELLNECQEVVCHHAAENP